MRFCLITFILLSNYLLFSQHLQNNFEITHFESIDITLSFRGIFSVDENNCWVSGNKGSVYRTDDGGISWMKIEIPGSSKLDFRDVHVLSDNTIVIMSAGSGTDSRIYNSTDNGKTWKIKYQNKYPNGFLDSIEFWDKKNGLAFGDPVDSTIFILLTKDGGETWQEVNSQNIPRVENGEAGFAASGSCISVYENNFAWIGTGGSTARIFKTSDAGISWVVYNTPQLIGQNSTGIFSVCFRSENEGVIAGGDYTKQDDTNKTIAHSLNGGETWNLIDNQQIPFQSCVRLLRVSNQSYYISTGPSATYFSSDPETWELIFKKGYHCLSISGYDQTVWLAGSEGQVARIRIIQ